MSSSPHEFHYRLPARAGGFRPGSHRGTSLGPGQEFTAHKRLLDNPDPRRLDLRASVRNLRQEWLVRVHRQRVSVPVHAVVDVSASMRFGARASKLDVAADFLEGLGHSAFRAGDPVGMLAFDASERTDLFVPARHSRGAGYAMSAMLRDSASDGTSARPGGAEGLAQAAQRLADRHGLVFLVSDFHWALEALDGVLDMLAQAYVVPIITWDPAETEPPPGNALLAVRDAETGHQRTLWLGKTLRARWRDAVAQRRARLDALFLARGLRPVYMQGSFEAEALSRYFIEAVA
ncbi:MxaS protein [Cupriavidus necator]|uniref:DUF58 domain-containing protein n=1 Tax=Cupriavidus necator TaxID=106590 RepID=UPI0039C102D5